MIGVRSTSLPDFTYSGPVEALIHEIFGGVLADSRTFSMSPKFTNGCASMLTAETRGSLARKPLMYSSYAAFIVPV